MTEATFWTQYGPLLADQLNQIKSLEKQVEYWKTAFHNLKAEVNLNSKDEPERHPEVHLQPILDQAPDLAKVTQDPPRIRRKRKESAKKIKIQTCGCCYVSQTPQWRKNNGDPNWGDQICNACWSRQKRKLKTT